MDTQTFNLLLNKINVDKDNGLDSIACTSKVGKYQMSFYSDGDNNHQIVFEDFGFMKNNQWIQEQPTPDQIEVLQQVINDTIQDITYEMRQENQDDNFNGDYYELHGVSKAMFY